MADNRIIRLHLNNLPRPNLVYPSDNFSFLSLSIIPIYPSRSSSNNATDMIVTSSTPAYRSIQQIAMQNVEREHVQNRNLHQDRPQQTSSLISGRAVHSGATGFAHECSTINGNILLFALFSLIFIFDIFYLDLRLKSTRIYVLFVGICFFVIYNSKTSKTMTNLFTYHSRTRI